MNMRGLIIAGVAALTVTGAMAQFNASYLYSNNWGQNVTNIQTFQSGNSSTYLIQTNATVANGATQPINVGGGMGSFSSLLMGVVSGIPGDDPGSHIVVSMQSSVAYSLVGVSWEDLFADLNASTNNAYSEANVAMYLMNANSYQTELGVLSQAFTNLSANGTNYGNAWFDGSGPFTNIKFSVGVVPEPFTMALIGLAPLAYLKRRKSKAA